MLNDAAFDRVISQWTRALHDAERLYAHLNPGHPLRADDELFAIARQAFVENRNPQDILAELFPERNPVGPPTGGTQPGA